MEGESIYPLTTKDEITQCCFDAEQALIRICPPEEFGELPDACTIYDSLLALHNRCTDLTEENQKLREALEKSSKTFEQIKKIVCVLKDARETDLPELVHEIDLPFTEIQLQIQSLLHSTEQKSKPV